jgi:hypothetical protein
MDLDGPPAEGLIRTDYGDLLIDDEFRGRVYLKGLRTDSFSPGGHKYVFGYNFADGHIGRDRERLTNAREEAKMVATIWESAILGKQSPDITRKYIELFSYDERAPDVSLAEDLISEATARAVWSQMRQDSPHSFFYALDVRSGEGDEANQVRSKILHLSQRSIH